MKKLVILGSTGSIGTQALEIVAALRRARRWSAWPPARAGSRLLEQARQHGVPALALADADAAERARAAVERPRAGRRGGDPRADRRPRAPTSCSTGWSAPAGLGPTIVALSEGIDVALANKESLVIGGELVTALAEATGARLLPVDSEHSALFQLIALRAARARSSGSS